LLTKTHAENSITVLTCLVRGGSFSSYIQFLNIEDLFRNHIYKAKLT